MVLLKQIFNLPLSFMFARRKIQEIIAINFVMTLNILQCYRHHLASTSDVCLTSEVCLYSFQKNLDPGSRPALQNLWLDLDPNF